MAAVSFCGGTPSHIRILTAGAAVGQESTAGSESKNPRCACDSRFDRVRAAGKEEV